MLSYSIENIYTNIIHVHTALFKDKSQHYHAIEVGKSLKNDPRKIPYESKLYIVPQLAIFDFEIHDATYVYKYNFQD